jgi:polar amino acid transport system permease protein
VGGFTCTGIQQVSAVQVHNFASGNTKGPLAGQFIATIKDSAIVSVISIQELTFQVIELMSSTYLTFEAWITIAAMYLLLSISLSLFIGRLDVYIRRRTV